MSRRLLTTEEVERQLADLPGWSSDGQNLRASIQFPTFLAAIRAVDAIAVEAEEMDHHPDMDIRWRTLHFTLATHSAGGVTQLDIEMAHRIAGVSEAASDTA